MTQRTANYVSPWVLAMLLAVVSIFFPGRAEAVQPEQKIEFNRDVRPILADKCFSCHGPDQKHREADLRLDADDPKRPEGVIVAGNANQSRLIERILTSDPETHMPPAKSGKALSDKEVNILRMWINSGAALEPHWAYVTPVARPAPNVAEASNFIDAFVMKKQAEQGVSMSPLADQRTLMRRLSFDLVGLPVTPQDMASFARAPAATVDESLKEYSDKLLNSDHFGERMAVFWLDLVRYADTVGYHGDQDHQSSPYRDYVIDAFNRNIPFDQFTREQLAGDLLQGAGDDQKAASCYNRLLQTSHEGGVQAKEYLAIYQADRVRNVSAVWLGATMGCAQCHDHKFDPYTMKDFYSLAAFFADIDEERHLKGEGGDTLPTKRPPEVPVLTWRERQRIGRLKAEIQQLEKAPSDTARDEKLKVARQQLESLEKNRRLVMVTQSLKEPRTIRILPRGNWLDDSGEVMSPAVPQFMGTVSVDGRANRLDLANWLTDPEKGAGGLTARVFVNRVWALFFGAGLCRSLDDFGGQGQSPDHPELLDALALDFIRSGWDIKHLVRTIVMSRTYQQSSVETAELLERDPENRMLTRQSSWRLPAEFVRDTALSVSGLLNEDVGGPSVRPYQPDGYYRHLNFPKRDYAADKDSRQWRRGVYVHWQRQFIHPMMKAFDAPSREECTAQRPRSNTPLAALVLLNDPTFLECARCLADRVLAAESQSDEERLKLAFQMVLCREPDEYEQTTLLELLEAERRDFTDSPDNAMSMLSAGISAQKSKAIVDSAAWTSVARALLNLSETFLRD